MRNKLKKEYPVKCYRLHPKTVKKLARLSDKTGLSYNRLFLDMMEKYNG